MTQYLSLNLSEFADKFSSDLIPNNIFVVKNAHEYSDIMRALFNLNQNCNITASGENEKNIIIHSDIELDKYKGRNFFVFYQDTLKDIRNSQKAS